MSRIRAIAVKTAPRLPMQEQDSATISIDAGIAGDFRGRQRGRQITLLAESAWRSACAEVGADLPWTTRRANLLVDEVEFDASWVGRNIRLGEVKLVVTEETAPCSLMDKQCPGLTRALTPAWRGGICCNVVEGGAIQIGEELIFD